MKRIIGTAIGALVYAAVFPLTALAQDGGSGLTPPTGGGVAGSGGTVTDVSGAGSGGVVAFTGTEVIGLISVAIVLLVAGLILVRVTRRRATVAHQQI